MKYRINRKTGDRIGEIGMGTSCVFEAGHCDSRCPFHVQQSARMQEIAAYFGA